MPLNMACPGRFHPSTPQLRTPGGARERRSATKKTAINPLRTQTITHTNKQTHLHLQTEAPKTLIEACMMRMLLRTSIMTKAGKETITLAFYKLHNRQAHPKKAADR